MIKRKYWQFAVTILTVSAVLFTAGCNKSSSTDSGGGGKTTLGTLFANPNAISVLVGNTASVTISGGKFPYSVKSNSDTSKVSAKMLGSTLSVTGVAVGTANVVVQDSAGASVVTVPVTVAVMISTPNPVTVTKGLTRSISISGGTQPYSIKMRPDSTKATVTQSGTIFNILGVAVGTTSVEIKDNAATPNSVVVPISVTEEFNTTKTTMTIAVGKSDTLSIMGGTAPYTISYNSASYIATVTISGSIVTVTGVSGGSMNFRVQDSSNPANTDEVYVTVTSTSLTANPSSITVRKNSTTSCTISNGVSPYSIQTQPNSSIATATISGSTLSVTGVAPGSTSVTVKDASTPTAKTVTIQITVTSSSGGFTTAGTLSFNSTKGNFSANGIYNVSSTSGSGAGGYFSGSTYLFIYAYRYNSPTNIDIIMLDFMDSSPIAAGTYLYPPTGSKTVMIIYMPGISPNDTTSNGYWLTSGTTATLTTVSSTNAAGTFSGSGYYTLNGVPNVSQTITVSSGTFNVPVISGYALYNPMNRAMEALATRLRASVR